MKIFVCVKQVPDTETKVRISSSGTDFERSGVKWVLNPYDEFAVEEAIKTRDANPGSQVIAISLGPKSRVTEVLRTALAMGADDGILVDAPESIDPMTTAQALSKAIQKEGPPDLVFSGKVAIDANQGCVSQMLAEYLKIPHCTCVVKFQLSNRIAKIERESEGGVKESIEMTLPGVVAATKGLNLPRYASLPGIMKAKKKVLKEFGLQDLGVSSFSLGMLSKVSLPPERPAAKIIGGDPTTQVQALVQALKNQEKVI